MKPLIGITCDYDLESDRFRLHNDYCKAIYTAGGLPVILPYVDFEGFCSLASNMDGIMFTGGGDIDPHYFNEYPHPALGETNPVRDRMEIELCKWAIDNNKPVLGICRGIQVMNVAVGGSLYQDIANQLNSEIIINHRQNAPGWYPVHQVKLDLDSKIGRIMRREHIRVNSFHHQAVKDVVYPFCATGRSDDGVVEVIESKQHTFVMGVQWHPERMYAHDKGMLSLFKAFVQACIKI